MNKAQLVERVRSVADLSKRQAEAVVDEVLTSVMDSVRSGERVSLSGFGTFNQTSRAPRMGRNPQTGAPVKIAAAKSVRFAPSTAFKSALNAKRAAKKAAATKKAPGRATATKATATKGSSKASGVGRGAAGSTAKKAARSTRKR